jgi:hypothetical protein
MAVRWTSRSRRVARCSSSSDHSQPSKGSRNSSATGTVMVNGVGWRGHRPVDTVQHARQLSRQWAFPVQPRRGRPVETLGTSAQRTAKPLRARFRSGLAAGLARRLSPSRLEPQAHQSTSACAQARLPSAASFSASASATVTELFGPSPRPPSRLGVPSFHASFQIGLACSSARFARSASVTARPPRPVAEASTRSCRLARPAPTGTPAGCGAAAASGRDPCAPSPRPTPPRRGRRRASCEPPAVRRNGCRTWPCLPTIGGGLARVRASGPGRDGR